MIVVDASALAAALLRTPEEMAKTSVVIESELHAPHLIDIELASVLRKLVAAGKLAAPRAEAALQDYLSLGMTLYPHGPLLDRVWQLRNNLSPYDAAYVALAELLDAPLVTRDRRLAAAPGHGARIEVI